MGRWSEDDLLIYVDLDDGSYCNGAYGPPSNMRVSADTGCNLKEFRLHFLADGDIATGEEINYNYGAFAISSDWAEFGL